MKFKVLFFLLLFSPYFTACGSKDKPQTSDVSSDALASGALDEIVIPPKEYYDAALNRELQLLGEDDPNFPQLFVDFDGASLDKGFGVGESFILCKRSADIPDSGFNFDQQKEIILKVREFFREAGTNLKVVAAPPSSGRYTTIIVGGSMKSLGCREQKGVLGIAPYDRGNTNKDDIGFAFTRYVNNVQVTAETIAHEAGHTYGLDHIRQQNGLMYYANSGIIDGFIDGRTSGGRRQNAPMILQRDVGKLSSSDDINDDDISDIPTDIPQPEDSNDNNNDSDPVADTNPGDQDQDSGNSDTGLFPGWDQIAGIGDLLGGLIPGGGLTNLPDLLGGITGLIPGGLGGLGGLGNLGNLGNIPGVGGIPTSIPDFSNIGGLNGIEDIFQVISQQSGSLSSLPDLSQALNLGNFADTPAIFSSLRGNASMVKQNFRGDQRESLLSALKVGYLQSYRNLIRLGDGE